VPFTLRMRYTLAKPFNGCITQPFEYLIGSIFFGSFGLFVEESTTVQTIDFQTRVSIQFVQQWRWFGEEIAQSSDGVRGEGLVFLR
jgi:hypothetical protein